MLAFATHMLELGASNVEIHPDGQHARHYDIGGWLKSQGFTHAEHTGTTDCGGRYTRDLQTLCVKFSPGVGDVIGELNSHRIVAECKGGVINTSHAGQQSRLRKGLCETIGQLFARPLSSERLVAVVPNTPVTLKLAKRMARRAAAAGIEIALVHSNGAISYVTS